MARTDDTEPVPRGRIVGGRIRRYDTLGRDIGDRIMIARRRARIGTRIALCERTREVDEQKKGISTATLKGYEDGYYRPGARELRLLSLALGVSPTWLLFGTETPGKAGRARPSSFTLAKAIDAIPDRKRAAAMVMFLSRMKRDERDAWINLIEISLRARWGDQRFELFQRAFLLLCEKLQGNEGRLAEHMARIMSRSLTAKELTSLEQTVKRRAMELGIDVLSTSSKNPARL